jgi:hypothetical protein
MEGELEFRRRWGQRSVHGRLIRSGPVRAGPEAPAPLQAEAVRVGSGICTVAVETGHGSWWSSPYGSLRTSREPRPLGLDGLEGLNYRAEQATGIVDLDVLAPSSGFVSIASTAGCHVEN